MKASTPTGTIDNCPYCNAYTPQGGVHVCASTKTNHNVIKLHTDAVAPEIMARRGTVHLHFGYADDRQTVELDGSLTISEICFLKERLGSWIRQRLEEMG
jgi:hypothetical protein